MKNTLEFDTPAGRGKIIFPLDLDITQQVKVLKELTRVLENISNYDFSDIEKIDNFDD